MAYCPICKEKFKTTQGLRGHLNFKHGQARASIFTEAIGRAIKAHHIFEEKRDLEEETAKPEIAGRELDRLVKPVKGIIRG